MSVQAVSASATHHFSKTPCASITLITNHGVQGDCHAGATVQHRSRLRTQPPPPNLRQVHLIHSELLAEFKTQVAGDADGKAYDVKPGDLGENITTLGIDLLGLGRDTRLHLVAPGTETIVEDDGAHPVLRVTGLRNPCPQIDGFMTGLKERCIVRDEARAVVDRKAGIMAVVEVGGVVKAGDWILIQKPSQHQPLECV